MGNAWDTAKDGIMSEEDYPYEHKVIFAVPICWVYGCFYDDNE